MSTIRLSTASNLRTLETLSRALRNQGFNSTSTTLIDEEALNDEFGRFRVWAGNLGALQMGHSSLDYRLRDSPLLSSNVLKLLTEMEANLGHAHAIVSGARLPYEQQTVSSGNDDDENVDFFSEEEDSEEEQPKYELEMRLNEVIDIIDNLYKLSVRIRTPTIRSRALKASSYQPKDPETGVDLFEQYATFDRNHAFELVRHLRKERDSEVTENDILINRLGLAVTQRRKYFQYWRRHRDKLGISILFEDQPQTAQPVVERLDNKERNDTREVNMETPNPITFQDTNSRNTKKTLLSGTEATHHHQSLDDIVDSKSMTSYATTARDISGRGIELPPQPKAADGERDFECPYCFIICPARYSKTKAWRTHLLHDLQPYVCTYQDCEIPERLFRSRSEWVEHEASHRKAWRCPEHPTAIYRSPTDLKEHLSQIHQEIPRGQLISIVNVSETATIDLRSQCPICLLPTHSKELGNMQNHIANHLERLACFALPNYSEGDSDDSGSMASRGRSANTESQNLSVSSLHNSSSGLKETEFFTDTSKNFMNDSEPQPTVEGELSPSQGMLSAESLHDIPDATKQRLDTLMQSQSKLDEETTPAATYQPIDKNDESQSVSSVSTTNSQSYETIHPPPVLDVSQSSNLRSLYRSGRIPQKNTLYTPNDAYNQLISWIQYDVTCLKVDAIVNSANQSVKSIKGSTTLNHYIHKRAGPRLKKECERQGRVKSGQAIITLGYDLPCKYVIHAGPPTFFGRNTIRESDDLAESYRNSLKLALENSVRTIAFCCLGTGGSGIPPRTAAQTALQQVRKFLDTHREYEFERIIFCVRTSKDERAYMEFFSVFFPVTESDLEVHNLPGKKDPRNCMAVDMLVRGTHNQTVKVKKELSEYSKHVPNFPNSVLGGLANIAKCLLIIKRDIPTPADWGWNYNEEQLTDLDLACSVLQSIYERVLVITELEKVHKGPEKFDHSARWNPFESHMRSSLGWDPVELIEKCEALMESLTEDLKLREAESEDMGLLRKTLIDYKTKHIGKGGKGTQDRFDESLFLQAQQEA